MKDLHVETRGQGPALVLLHGWGLNLRVWDRLGAALAERFRVIAVDLPGHGRSAGSLDGNEREVLVRLLRSVLDGERAAVLGWSLGGQLALRLAAEAPEHVSRLVLVATTPRFAAGDGWVHGMAAGVLQHFATQLATDYRRTVGDFLELQVRGSADAPAVLRELEAALFAHGIARPEALAAGLGLLAATDLRPLLGRIRMPALVIAGQYDRVTPPAASRALAAELPLGSYFEFHRAAHAPFLSHPDEFAAAAGDFLVRPA